MSRYEVAHDCDGTWICKNINGTFYWGNRNDVYRFKNFKEANKAVLSLPDEIRLYGVSYRKRIKYMKFYDSEEHRNSEIEYINAKRFYFRT